MKKVLVTGGAGYIGSHVVAQLVLRDYQVVVLDNLSTGHRSLLHPEAQFVEGDIRDEELIRRTFEKFEINSVLHFAALTSVEESLRKPEEYYDNNFSGTLSLLRACEGSSVKNFIFSSTAAVYGGLSSVLVSEDAAIDPATPYGKSKSMSELALKDCGAAYGLRYGILRYFNVAGASMTNRWGQIGDQHSALVKRVAMAAVGKLPELCIFGTDYPTMDGTAVRDYIHVEDLAEIHIQALEKLSGEIPSLLLNCGYGTGFSVRQVIEMMKQVSGKKFTVREASRRPGDLASVVANNSKLVATLNWRPRRNDLRLICQSAFDWESRLVSEKS